MKTLSIEYLNELFIPDFEAGTLTWKERPLSHFKTYRSCDAWNNRYSGGVAGCPFTRGYLSIKVDGVNYVAHKIIYGMYYNKWPSNQLDHINGVTHDNRIKNLRHVSQKENSRNQKRYNTNTSGATGVTKSRDKWKSYIVVNGIFKYLGCHNDWFDAVCARKSADVKYGFNENHGRNIEVSK